MKRSGFTMIELIFVIVILGILAAVAIPKLAATRDDATVSNIASTVATAASALPAWFQGRKEALVANAMTINTADWAYDSSNEKYVYTVPNASAACVTLQISDQNTTSSATTSVVSQTDAADTGHVYTYGPVLQIVKGTDTGSICTGVWDLIQEQNITMSGTAVLR